MLPLRLTSIARFHAAAKLLSYPASKTGKPLLPYIRFASEKRPEILKENPSLKTTEVGRKCGELWRSLSQSEKKTRTAEYEAAREKYTHGQSF